MPLYVYKARTVAGESQSGEISAATEADVVGQLRSPAIPGTTRWR